MLTAWSTKHPGTFTEPYYWETKLDEWAACHERFNLACISGDDVEGLVGLLEEAFSGFIERVESQGIPLYEQMAGDYGPQKKVDALSDMTLLLGTANFGIQCHGQRFLQEICRVSDYDYEHCAIRVIYEAAKEDLAHFERAASLLESMQVAYTQAEADRDLPMGKPAERERF